MTQETALATTQRITPDLFRMFVQLDEQAAKSRKYGVVEGEVAVLYCYELNIPLSTAFQGVYLVNGRLEVQGRVLAMLFKRHPHYDYTINELTMDTCTLVCTYDGEAIGSVTWDKARATQAGLWGKDNWAKNPDDMLYNKCLARLYKRYAPDLADVQIDIREDSYGSTWEVVDAEPAPAVKAPFTPDVSLPDYQDIVNLLGPTAVVGANDGKIPQTEAEIDQVRSALAVVYEDTMREQEAAGD